MVCAIVGAASLAEAQTASIAGVVRDASGAVLPGVTVEASSPALIERVRSTVSDENGQYRLLSLPVGTYAIRFSLAGFSAVSREGISLETGFTANINPELRVGAVEETITVTGEAPVVDVESARQMRVVDGDALRELPSGRGPSQILSMIPGMNGGSGVCSGGTCGPTLNAFSAHGGNTTEGRLQVDGMGAGAAIGGAGVSGYLVDVANAQEISVSLSGGLGEAEVGGPVINVIPRSGGNNFSGSYFTSYTRSGLWDKNNETHSNINVTNSRDNDHDVNGSFGGPLRRDRLWFFMTARHEGSVTNTPNSYRNLNEGVFGANFVADLSKPVQTVNTSKNVLLRLAWQGTPRNRFTFSWDEQNWCTSCEGAGSGNTSPEAATTASVGPNRVHQFTWTNPFTNRLLFEGRFSTLNQNWGIWPHFEETFYQNIPRITETGTGAGLTGNITSGAQTSWDADTSNTNMHLSASYITGSHQLKAGWQSTLMGEWTSMDVNRLRLHYTYTGTAASGVPVPTQFTMFARPRTTNERSRFNAFYVQDQWKVGNRVTLNGALRYDHAWSYFPEQSTGPDRFIPIGYGFEQTDGVSFDDINPRWSAAWDVFGNGRTALKYHMGRYLQPVQVGGIYNATNPMRRSPDSLNRGWTDVNGNRVVECDFNNPAQHTLPGGDTCFAAAGITQFGLDPRVTGVGFTTTHCGRAEQGISQSVLDYCNALGQNLISGFGKREFDWQYGLTLQHEVLPRVSAEVSYNRRWYGNFYLTDDLNRGCNRGNDACISSTTGNPDYDFLSLRAPEDPRLPDGGGYLVTGLSDIKPSASSRPTLSAISLNNDEYRYWHGIDTNVTVRAIGGLRLQGGTSTGRQVEDDCAVLVDSPENRTVGDNSNCHAVAPFQTKFRGTSRYVIPRIDVLVSSVFQYRPGAELAANLVVTCTATAGCPLTWAPGSTPGRGETVFLSAGTTKTVNLLPNNTMYGEGHAQFDLKVGKIVRFAGVRANIGADIYNLLNTDAITGYNQTYSPNAPGGNPWLRPTTLVQPRFARLQVQLDF